MSRESPRPKGKRAARGTKTPATRRKRARKSNALPTTFPEAVGDRVLALDTSSRCIGWSVFEDGRLSLCGKYVFEGDGHGEKLGEFRKWLADLFMATNPTEVLVEMPYSGRFPAAFAVLIRYVAVVEEEYWAWFAREMPASSKLKASDVKKWIKAAYVGTHEGNKLEVLTLVNERFGLDLKWHKGDDKVRTDDDIADGIAINWAWHLRHRTPLEVAE